MEDKMLTCKDCSAPFVFSAREQQFFAEKGFANEPQRCRECRQTRRAQTGSTAPSGTRPSFDVVCATCGVNTTVPFRPRGDRPVLCRSCFTAKVPVGA